MNFAGYMDLGKDKVGDQEATEHKKDGNTDGAQVIDMDRKKFKGFTKTMIKEHQEKSNEPYGIQVWKKNFLFHANASTRLVKNESKHFG